jgi:hypothetical protein
MFTEPQTKWEIMAQFKYWEFFPYPAFWIKLSLLKLENMLLNNVRFIRC